MEFPKFEALGLDTKINKRLDSVGLDLLSRFFVLDPMKRISCKEALKHPWFEGMNSNYALF